MREETRRRLERQLWLDRAKWAAAGLAILVCIAGGIWATGLDATVETRHVPGIVSAVGPLVGGTIRANEEGLSVDVKLDDGRQVHVMAMKKTDPHVGDRVEIAEHVHGTGRVTYSWR
ncbi:hypothetical protein [Hyphomicrobium sp. CS1GBMeth3]|uniref:hypothetical protein n=1 Tax=Hyphomicrobium sp. CS1GBMeth3 TaxID=1892845 RepID=UPI000931BEAF|nr:hypothetical protein [Hyphomicrobium sp. CS1GBMeth3]